MSFTIPDDSPRRAVALRFGKALRETRLARGVDILGLERAIGRRAHTTMYHYERGRLLPTTKVAARLAEALAAPELLQIVLDYRQRVCPIDGRTFVDDGGNGKKRYCSAPCRVQATRHRARMHAREAEETQAYLVGDPAAVLVARLNQELERARQHELRHAGGGGYVRRREVRDAIQQWQRDSASSMHRRLQLQLGEHLAAAEAMCRSCEPEGLCRTAECPLRPVSPLPLVPLVGVSFAQRTEKDPERVARGRIAAAAKMREWWANGDRRRAQAERSRRFWESLTPAERAEHMAKVRAGQRARRTEATA